MNAEKLSHVQARGTSSVRDLEERGDRGVDVERIDDERPREEREDVDKGEEFKAGDRKVIERDNLTWEANVAGPQMPCEVRRRGVLATAASAIEALPHVAVHVGEEVESRRLAVELVPAGVVGYV